MLKYRNFGRKSLNELSKVLDDMGLSFGMDVSQYLSEEELKPEKEEKERKEADEASEEGKKTK